MPSLKSLFVLGVATLSAFAFPAPSAGDALAARSDVLAPVLEILNPPSEEPPNPCNCSLLTKISEFQETKVTEAYTSNPLVAVFDTCQKDIDDIKKELGQEYSTMNVYAFGSSPT
jgi:hypothetical protein